MTPAIVHRFSIPIREAMAALLEEHQVDAESYEVRVLDGHLVIDLVDPTLPFQNQLEPVQTRAMIEREELEEMADAGEAVELPEEETSSAAERRFFYHPDNDTLLQTEDGTVHTRAADETGWIEIDAKEAEEIAAEHAKQGGLFGAGEDAAEQPAPEEQEERTAQRKGGKLAQRAGIICAEKAFWQFMDSKSEQEATDNLRATCGVNSRADLDHDKRAGREFEKLEASYRHWLANPVD